MSSVVIAGNTSGTVTLAAPDVAGTTTLTLPTTNGTLVTTASGQALTSPTITGTATLNGVNMTPYTMKNRIINGGMVIDQRNGTTSVSATESTFNLDRWKIRCASNSKFTTQQVSTAPAGFSNSLLITSSANTSLSAFDYYFLEQAIEGFNTADLNFGTANAKTITLSMWVQSSITGTFGGAIQSSGSTRSYPFSYTISAANTWTFISITIPGDTSGTWVGATNGAGIVLRLNIASGTSLSGTPNAWVSADYEGPTGATNLLATNGNTMNITGVQLEVGSVASAFEWRPYGQELNNCFRYYYKYPGSPNIHGMLYSSGKYIGTVFFPATMRTTPTIADLTGNYGTIENVGVSGMYMMRLADNTYLTTYSASAEL